MAQPSLCVFLLVVACTTYTTALRDQQILSAPLACTTVSTCKAVCSNGITLNISDLFKYTALTTRGDYYNFVYDPCRGNVCGSGSKKDNSTAMCQVDIASHIHQNYTCGRVDSAEWTILQTNPYIFKVVYKSNNDSGIIRTSVVTFYEEPSRLDTQFKYISQNPIYTYNFEVRGSFVGQPKNPHNTCKVDSTHCRAVCGGDVVLDISGIFKNDIASARGDYYQFVYSPCKGGYCAHYLDTTAMCQVELSPPNQNYSCGRVDITEWTLEQRDPYIFTVVYNNTNSTYIHDRRTVVTFREDSTKDETNFKFVSQYPVFTFNFEVIGKYVGQPAKNTDKLCTVDESNHCVATCDGRKFDISKVFEYPVTSTAGSKTYSYSPCDGGSTCGWTHGSALCQNSSDYSYSVGSENSIVWWLKQTEPYYIFTIEYKQGDQGRIGTVKFVENKNMTSSIFRVTKEPTSSEPLYYEFEVQGSIIGQPRSHTAYRSMHLVGLAPGVPLVTICVVVVLLLLVVVVAVVVVAGISGRYSGKRKDIPLLE